VGSLKKEFVDNELAGEALVLEMKKREIHTHTHTHIHT